MDKPNRSSSDVNLNRNSSISSLIEQSSTELSSASNEDVSGNLDATGNDIFIVPEDSTDNAEKDANSNLIDEKSREKPTSDHKTKKYADLIGRFPALHNSTLHVNYILAGFSKYMGWGPPGSKKVHFPQEIINQYEAKGDIAGKDRFVPRSKQPYRKPKTRRKSGSLIIAVSKDFEPRIERIEDESALDSFCERKCIACECFKNCRCGSKPPDSDGVEKPKDKSKVKLSDVTEGFLYTVTVAEAFILGHRTITFAVAVQALDLPSTVELQKAALSPDFMKASTLLNAKMSRSRLGLLATNIWTFAYCIPLLFENNNAPTESSFWNLMEQFGALAVLVEDESSTLLAQYTNFYNFAEECMRIIRILQLKLDFEGDTTIHTALLRGDGLQLMKLKSYKISSKPKVIVQLGKLVSEGNVSNWTDFLSVSDFERIQSLKHLLNLTSEGHALAQLQVRFLVDDVIESTSDLMNETDILFTLGDMYDRISFMEAQPDTIQKDIELEVLRKAMTQFTLSLHKFIVTSQHMMEKVMELRDMIQVACTFFQEECNLKLTPRVIPDTMYQRWGVANCCGRGSQGEYSMPKYKGQDLFRTYYEDATKVPFLPAETVFFNLEESATDKMKRPGKGLTLSFSKSVASTPLNMSFCDVQGTISEDDIASQTEIPDLKPILVKSSITSDMPTASSSLQSTDEAGSLFSNSSQAMVLPDTQQDTTDLTDEEEPIPNSALAHSNSMTKLKKLKAKSRRK